MSRLGQSVLEQGIVGSIQILNDIGYTEEQILEKIIKQYTLDEEEAKRYLANVNLNLNNI